MDMSDQLETRVKPLSGFSRLNAPHQLAVRLRADGATYRQISAALESEYEFKRAEATIKEWFEPGGVLEQAYVEWQEVMADTQLRDAKLLAKRLSKSAVVKAKQIMDTADDATALKASIALMSKYIPDERHTRLEVSLDTVPYELDDDLDAEGSDVLDEIRGESR